MFHPHHTAALQQQQQHHMMMMQQQQQQIAMMQHQQQQMAMMQQQQSQALYAEQQHLRNDTVHDEDDVQTEQISNKERTVEDWHEGLEEEAAVEGHEGWTQGATMEELAAAWAQAEAEYEEYVVVLL
jgi:hypothetical protein